MWVTTKDTTRVFGSQMMQPNELGDGLIHRFPGSSDEGGRLFATDGGWRRDVGKGGGERPSKWRSAYESLKRHSVFIAIRIVSDFCPVEPGGAFAL